LSIISDLFAINDSTITKDRFAIYSCLIYDNYQLTCRGLEQLYHYL